MMMLAIAAVSCVVLSGANITAGDLAKAVPAFAPADPSAIVSYAPSPGVRRVFHAAELHQTLSRLGFAIETSLNDVCFERALVPLANDAVVKAMQQALGAAAHVEIVELSRFPAPPGELVFPREGLGYPPVALWHGYVRYDGEKRFPVWARAKVSIASSRVMALEDLKPGVPMRASELKLVSSQGFPERHTAPQSLEELDGCIPRHFIAADSPVWTDSYNPPNDVNKGERVVVHVHSGQAQLSFGADAESSGRRGDEVSIKNPESGRVFRARVEGPGEAWVQTFR